MPSKANIVATYVLLVFIWATAPLAIVWSVSDLHLMWALVLRFYCVTVSSLGVAYFKGQISS